MRIVSAPNISGTSVSTAEPPREVIRSATVPQSGLAVTPDRESEPPHLKAILSSDTGTRTRLSRFTISASSRKSSSPVPISSPASWVTSTLNRSRS